MSFINESEEMSNVIFSIHKTFKKTYNIGIKTKVNDSVMHQETLWQGPVLLSS